MKTERKLVGKRVILPTVDSKEKPNYLILP